MKKEKDEAARMKKAQTDWTETVPLSTLNNQPWAGRSETVPLSILNNHP